MDNLSDDVDTIPGDNVRLILAMRVLRRHFGRMEVTDAGTDGNDVKHINSHAEEATE